MKSTGVVRRTDDLGRIVIPKELRRALDIKERDPVEIFVEDDLIILQKFKDEMACTITGKVTDKNKRFGNIVLSPDGIEELMKELKKEVVHS
ncbi:AbrB/MazE/SpoVT family DNA-binding domain-containing protein [Bacillus infantis]|uniref:AbrB/MazE/SpoVT family DNA-binding domain-containing protein n=1 Tax=Bacillus infantis TaxID=324767 RepID=UPI0020059F41|nr:AbrB/MazE/SpoVT family DNA-binding domain-containing protein [Bacillus infantis]MCK6208479.1 AbrB/MazE/SpoVT family DNA-binding domain-containing protein [Bacillus infantis]MCP1161459.1 AbrB/MazE/SpoVT family DNA-binding domain-containing protein [Bacillus infantis]